MGGFSIVSGTKLIRTVSATLAAVQPESQCEDENSMTRTAERRISRAPDESPLWASILGRGGKQTAARAAECGDTWRVQVREFTQRQIV